MSRRLINAWLTRTKIKCVAHIRVAIFCSFFNFTDTVIRYVPEFYKMFCFELWDSLPWRIWGVTWKRKGFHVPFNCVGVRSSNPNPNLEWIAVSNESHHPAALFLLAPRCCVASQPKLRSTLFLLHLQAWVTKQCGTHTPRDTVRDLAPGNSTPSLDFISILCPSTLASLRF